MVTKVTGKNQITIPSVVAKRMGIVPGTALDWQYTDSEGILEVRVLPPVADWAEALKGAGQRHSRAGGSQVKALHDERASEETDRTEDL